MKTFMVFWAVFAEVVFSCVMIFIFILSITMMVLQSMDEEAQKEAISWADDLLIGEDDE